jgi:lysine-specific demethylase/histidyl-hydroxylase NO66
MSLYPVRKAPPTAAHPERPAFMTAAPTAQPIPMVEPTAARMPEPIPMAEPTAARMLGPIPMAEPTAAQMPGPIPTAALTAVPTKAPKTAGDRSLNDPLRRLTGLSVSAFDAAHWGRQPLHHRAAENTSGGFDDLFSRAAVDELLSRRGLRTPFLRLTRNGDVIPAARYTRSGGAGAEIADQIADDKVLAEFAAGATLVLQGLHRTWTPIGAFAGALAADIGHPVQVNAYVTPPTSQGLTPHYDVHDVFLVQFAGRKHWRIHEPVLPSPVPDQPWQKRKASVIARSHEPPLLDIVLEPGDVLYLPRGYIHSATSLDEISGHLTIGIHPVTRLALTEHIFATLAGDLTLRRSLPAGLDLGAAEFESELALTITALRAALDTIDPAVIARGVGRSLDAATRPQPLAPLAQFTLAEALTPATRLRLRAGLHVAVDVDDEHAIVHLPDKDLRLPLDAADAIRAATAGSAVAAETLPNVDVDAAMQLLSQLVRAGVLVGA